MCPGHLYDCDTQRKHTLLCDACVSTTYVMQCIGHLLCLCVQCERKREQRNKEERTIEQQKEKRTEQLMQLS